ncbi:MAG: MBL fold metallo-hydrolase [Candidatus Helarchaeota archaeon]
MFPKRGISNNANVTFIRNPKNGSISFIDSGSARDPGIGLIERVLKPLNPSFKDSKLLITHGHLDHCHAAGLLQKKFNLKLLAHEKIILNHGLSISDVNFKSSFDEYAELLFPYIKNYPFIKTIGYYFYSRLYYGKQIKARLDVKLKDGDVVEVPPFSFRIIHAPGHSDDSIILHDPMKKIMFLGDFIPWTPYPDSSIEDFRRTIKKILKLDVKIVIRGHGYPHLWKKEKQDFLSFLNDMHKAELRILNCLKIGQMSLKKISYNVYERSHFKHNLFYTVLMGLTTFWTKKYVDDLMKKNLIKIVEKKQELQTVYALKKD